MKKLLFGIIATVIFGFVGNAQINYSDYGYYHNQLLDLYFSKYKLAQEESFNTFADKVVMLAKQNYPGKFDNVDVKILYNAYSGQSVQKFDFLKLWNEKKTKLSEYKTIGVPLVKLMEDSYNGKYTIDEGLNKLSELQNSKNITTKEANALIVVKSVLTSSHSYWIANGYQTSNKITPKEIADCAMILIFWESGPIGAIGSLMASGCF